MKIFFSVGEPSGDLHGTNLIEALRACDPSLNCVGYGGPKMASAGCALHADLTQHAIMGFTRAIAHLPAFWRLVTRAGRYFHHHRPDAVVLIDYPGFNWWIARRAKAHGIPVFYYGVPQMWAWAGWRVKKMRRLVDHALCKLPFEKRWYEDRDCRATYVGHPYFDELRSRKLDDAFVDSLTKIDRPLVTLLPGSRSQEVASNLEAFTKAAKLIRSAVPNTRFAVASFNSKQANFARKALADSTLEASVFVGKTPELIEAATCCLAVSGSVSLELLFHAKPTVIHYKVSRLAHFGQRFFRKVKFITLVNLLAAEDPFPEKVGLYDPDDPVDANVPMPEYLTWRDESSRLAAHVVEWLTDEAAVNQRIRRLKALSAEVDEGGASERAARYIMDELNRRPQATVRPHAAQFAA